MAKDGLFVLCCAGAVLGAAGLIPGAPPPEAGDSAVVATLALQTAMQQARDYLQRGDARSAVFTLEKELGRVNGHAGYLALLRDAYRAFIQQLQKANQEAEAQRYLQRLLVLDPGATLDSKATAPAKAPAAVAPAKAEPLKAPIPPVANAPGAPPKAGAPPKGEPTVRMLRQEDDPFQPPAADAKKKSAGVLLARAEEEFANRRFPEAAVLFEQAHQADPIAQAATRERWGYCKLHRVIEQLNQAPAVGLSWSELEREVRLAMEMAPRIEQGKNLLNEIDKRKSGAPTQPAPKPAPALVTVRHSERGSDGWARADTPNFCIFHRQSRELGEKVAQSAERTRTEMSEKWLGKVPEDWSPRCTICVYDTVDDYARLTGQSKEVPGHSTYKTDGARVVSRQIDLHCQDLNRMLTAVLPHETTHIVLVGQVGEQPLPRWADEGIAVLSEPRERVEPHLRNLAACRQAGSLLSMKQLLQLGLDYPSPQHIKAFYAQSVSLVEFLVSRKGPQALTACLREAQKIGAEQAVQKHYGFRSFDDLQQQWTQKAFPNPGNVAQVGQ